MAGTYLDGSSPESWTMPAADVDMNGSSGIRDTWKNCSDHSQTNPRHGHVLEDGNTRFLDHSRGNRLGHGSFGMNYPTDMPEFPWAESPASPHTFEPFNAFSYRRSSYDSAIGSAVMDTPIHSPDMGRKSFYSPDFRQYSNRYESISPTSGFRGGYPDSGVDSSDYQASPFMGYDSPEDTIDDGVPMMGKMFPDLPGMTPRAVCITSRTDCPCLVYSPPVREESESQDSAFAGILSVDSPPQLISIPSYSPTQRLSREAKAIIMDQIITPIMRIERLQAQAIKTMLSSVPSKIDSGEIGTLRDVEIMIINTPTKVCQTLCRAIRCTDSELRMIALLKST